MLNLELRYIWTEEYKHDYFYPIHIHDFYEMVYYPNGTGLLTADEKNFSVGEGNYAIIPPGIPHCETQYLGSKKFCIGFYCGSKIPLIYQKDPSGKINRVLNDMYKEHLNLQFNSRDFFSTKLNEMFVYINRYKANARQEKAITSNFEYIINTMEEKFNEKICFQDYAEQLNISYDYFRHKFKEITGFSPQEYIINKRLETAHDMLRTTNYSCTEISEKCGFSDSAQFSKMFREKYSMSPGQYRKI